ncbi:hypothetical protein [Magnetovibrio blakemorei]|nr:hypothetical protein [Magnetovibrio blakemorei]
MANYKAQDTTRPHFDVSQINASDVENIKMAIQDIEGTGAGYISLTDPETVYIIKLFYKIIVWRHIELSKM